MADNDYHIIKPVENLQNTAGLAGVKRREERKRRRNSRPSSLGPRDSSADGRRPMDDGRPPVEPEADRHSIDYCA